jgi:transposase-like protein/transposase
MTKPYTHDNDEQIAALYLSGRTGDEIGNKFGITDVTVYRALKRQGVPRRKSGARSSWEDTEANRHALVAAYESGTGISRLAKQFHINGRRVVKILNESGYTDRHPGGKRRFSEEDSAEFVRAYQSGTTLTEIAHQRDVSTKVVRDYLVRAGVQLRRVGAPPFWTEERKAEATQRYQAGEQLKEIASAMGCGPVTVARTLRELGVHEPPPRRRGENHHSWQGGRTMTEGGYIRIKIPDQDRHLADVTRDDYVLEHRLVMARKLGRPLLSGERPHHKNLIRSDNSPSNLELWLTVEQPPPGARVADLIEWSLGLLGQYMPEALVPGWQEMPRPEAIS